MTSNDRLSRRAKAGQWLREQRRRAGYQTAAEFGRAIGVSKEVASNYEVGRSDVPEDRAERIAQALGLDIITVRRQLGLWVPDTADLDGQSTEELIARAKALMREIQAGLDDPKARQAGLIGELIGSLGDDLTNDSDDRNK